MSRAHVELLTRSGCGLCERVHHRLAELAAELDFELTSTDVDAAAAAGEPATDAGNATAVITEPGMVAPPIGSAVDVPAVPAGAAALTSGVVLPAAVRRTAKAPGARVA
jgi:hypothetical protein